MSKHNKKRNSAIVYEILVLEMTKSIMNGDEDRKNTVLSLIKESFSKNSEMKKELDLYKQMQDLDGLKQEQIIAIFEELKSRFSSLNHSRLESEKSRSISKVNKTLGKNVWSNFVPNYRNLATISQIFNPHTPVKNRLLLESSLIREVNQENLEEKTELEPIDNIVYKTFVQKFNDKYSDDLTNEQKDILNHYIMSVNEENNVLFKLYINNKIGTMKKSLNESRMAVKDKKIRENLDEVHNLLESYQSKEVDEDMISTLMNIEALISEIVNVKND